MPSETVKVIVRVRPFNQREKDNQSKPCVRVDEKTNSVDLIKPQENDVKTFSYDYVFGAETPQVQIYEKTAFHLVESVVEGYNGTIFAYGQTGCGKTFTMIGNPNVDQFKGIIPRTFEQIINIINLNSDPNTQYLLRCSYIEIYNEEIHDLLSKTVTQRLDIKEDPNKGMFIKDLNIITVRTTQDMDKYMALGTQNRSVGETAMNKESSRSHCIFTVYIECSVTDAKGNAKITAGKLNLVDLAGSERQTKTQATGDRLKEATKINLSLSALGNVISALVDGKTQHIPYRDSKLTRLLQDSLGGNTKTIMITAVSPSDFNYDETLSSLRYASRAKQIKNQPKINQDPKDALLKEQAEEIQKLRQLLAKMQAGENLPPGMAGNMGAASNNKASNASGNNAAVSNNQAGNAQGNMAAPGSSQGNVAQQGQIVHSNTQTQQELEKLKKLLQEKEGAEIERKKDLEEAHNKLLQDKIRVEQEMKEKEQQAEKERQAREQLEALLKEKEKMIVQGGRGSEEEKKKYKNIQKKILLQKKEHEQLQQERDKQYEDMMVIEQKYQSIQEEVEQLRKLTKMLRKRFQEAVNDAKDVQRENETEKEDLLDTIRTQEKELKLYMGIVKMMFTNEEFEVLKGACDWDDEKQEYIVPPFIFKQKKVNYPKLPPTQANEFIEEEKLGRQMEIQGGKGEGNSERGLVGGDLMFDKRLASPNRKVDSSHGSLTQLDKGLLVVEKQRQSYQLMQQQQQYQQNYIPPQNQLGVEKKAQNVKLSPLDNNRVLQGTQNHSLQPVQNYSGLNSTPANTKKNANLQPLDRPPIPLPNDTPELRRKQPGRLAQ